MPLKARCREYFKIYPSVCGGGESQNTGGGMEKCLEFGGDVGNLVLTFGPLTFDRFLFDLELFKKELNYIKLNLTSAHYTISILSRDIKQKAAGGWTCRIHCDFIIDKKKEILRKPKLIIESEKNNNILIRMKVIKRSH